MTKKIGLFIILITGLIVTGVLSTNNVKAEGSNEKYSIDYLLKNYNAVTLGTKNNNIINEYKQTIQGTNKGDIKNLTVEGPVLASGEYANKVNENVNFEKMYAQLMNESRTLVDMTEYHINDYYINIDKPGIYMLNNTSKSTNYYTVFNNNAGTGTQEYIYYNNININNYQSDKYYIINIMDSMITNNFRVTITEPGAPAQTSFEDFVESGNYTGNIIFNYPNARYISANMINGSIIAPMADVYLNSEYPYYQNWNLSTGQVEYSQLLLSGIIISNSITHTGDLNLKYLPSTINEILTDEKGKQYIEEYKDNTDDIYYGDYKLSTLLKNYSVVSLGQKDYQPNTKYASLGYNKGSTSIFHITSQFLVNGDLGMTNADYPADSPYFRYYGDNTPNGFMRLDLDSNLVVESYLRGNIKTGGYSYYNEFYEKYYIKYWNMNSDNRGSKNHFYKKSNHFYEEKWYHNPHAGIVEIPDNFLNFNRLYNNIVAEQNAIEEGNKVKTVDGVAHIKIGGNYVIDDISEVNEIMFDNFEANKDEITIVTIKNSGSINFPLISKDTGNYKGIPTNDYYGKKIPNQSYEMNGLLPDEYHGNIIFNVPNANYIKLAPNAPFAGHLIAPNADLETEETQLAGCMIVNSLYAEGGSEAHFYPLTANLKCDCDDYDNLSDSMKIKFSEYRLNKLLGGDATTIETNILGDEEEYNNDTTTLEHVLNQCPSNGTNQVKKNPIVEVFTNPKTYRNLGLIVLVLVVLGVGIITYRKKENKKD